MPSAIAIKDVAKSICRREAYAFVTAGILIAYLIMTLFHMSEGWRAWVWLMEDNYIFNYLTGIAGMYLAAYFSGGWTSRLIIRNYSPELVGIAIGFSCLWLGTLMGSLVGFFAEGLARQSSMLESVIDYLYKPLLWVSLFGFIPVVLCGIWYGKRVRRKLRLLRSSKK